MKTASCASAWRVVAVRRVIFSMVIGGLVPRATRAGAERMRGGNGVGARAIDVAAGEMAQWRAGIGFAGGELDGTKWRAIGRRLLLKALTRRKCK